MLSELEQLSRSCIDLGQQGIVIYKNRCLHKRHLRSSCRRCSDVCANGAISCAEGPALIVEKCTGCGACAAVCPSGALAAQSPSSQKLRALAALHVQHSGAVAFACETYLKTHPAEIRRAVAVQCTARCDEALLVDAVLCGAASVSILNSSCTECRQHTLSGLVRAMVDTANQLLGYWQYPAAIALTQKIPETIKPLPKEGKGDAAIDMSRRAFLTGFTKKSESLVTQMLPEIILGTAGQHSETRVGFPNPMDEPKGLPEKWRLLLNSLNQFGNTAVSADFSGSLWGDIRIADSCNGCGACADACPTAALVAHSQEGLWRVTFDESHCTQCGLCRDICNCGSIHMNSAVALDTLFAQLPRTIIVKKQKEIDDLLAPPEQRMARLLGCEVKN